MQNCIRDKHTNDIGSLMANMQPELMTSYWHAPLSVQCDCRLFQGFWEGKEITTSISTNACQHFDKGFFWTLLLLLELFILFVLNSTLLNKPLKWCRVYKGNMPFTSHSYFLINSFEFLNHDNFLLILLRLIRHVCFK